MSVRMARVQEELRKVVSDIILKDMRDPRLGMVSVTEVEMSKDLSHAKIFISEFKPNEAESNAVEVLEKAKSFIRCEIGQKMQLRIVPEIVFMRDRSIEQSVHMQEVFKHLHDAEKKNDE